MTNNLISRQAAIDALNKLARENFTLINAFSFYLGALHDAADEIKNLPSAQSEQRWIPCSERLPEEKGEYLVTYHPCYWDNVDEEIKVGIDTFRGKTTWAKKKYQRVIAWQTLPEPWKDGEEDG